MRNPYSYLIAFFLAIVLAACGGQGTVTDVTGSWTAEATNPYAEDTYPFSMLLTQSGTSVTGTVRFDGPLPVTGSVADNIVTFGAQDATVNVQFSGIVNGNSMSGTVTITIGEETRVADFTATR